MLGRDRLVDAGQATLHEREETLNCVRVNVASDVDLFRMVNALVAALAIKPDNYEALNNWGIALSDQAKTKEGEEADRLFAEAYANYEAALAIKPDKQDTIHNWGAALSDQARTKEGEEADRLFAEAYANYEAALAIEGRSTSSLSLMFARFASALLQLFERLIVVGLLGFRHEGVTVRAGRKRDGQERCRHGDLRRGPAVAPH